MTATDGEFSETSPIQGLVDNGSVDPRRLGAQAVTGVTRPWFALQKDHVSYGSQAGVGLCVLRVTPAPAGQAVCRRHERRS